MEEAYRCAKEVLGLHLDDFHNPPVLSDIGNISATILDGFRHKRAGAPVPSDIGNAKQLYYIGGEDTTDNVVYYSNSDVPKIISEKIKELGYTKYKLAKVLDVSESYINLIAKCTRRPSPDMAKRIGLVLGLNWQVFFV
ncbi:MAG: helix-turn-helix domain-containing protein [Clostridiaceae bacterium]|jgi:S-adenosylmethionine synthetase|nr:helix-turn-helix domain-containing protein [Clostridiaceae bacterium]